MTKSKRAVVKEKGWAAIWSNEGEVGLINDVIFNIYPEDAKVFAERFVEARNAYSKARCTKVVPCIISYTLPKRKK